MAAQLAAEPVAARLRSGAEAPRPITSVAAAHCLPGRIASSRVLRASSVPLRLRHAGLGRAG
jgi:hypothetical protein